MATKHFDGMTNRIQVQALGNQYVHEIKRTPGYALLGCDVVLRGNIAFTGGSASGTSTGENPTGLIASIDVDAIASPDGIARGGKLKSVTPRSINQTRKFDRGAALADLGGGAIAGAATSYPINSLLPLEFALPTLARPIETALWLEQYDQIVITVNMGVITDMLSGNDRTVDVSGLYLEFIEHREYIGNGKNKNGGPLILGEIYEDQKTIQITAANTDFSLDTQLSQAQSYVHLFLITETTSKALSDAVLNKVQVYSGTDLQGIFYAAQVKGEQQKFIRDAATTMTGLYFLPQVKGMDRQAGQLSGVVPNVTCKLDISNPGTDRIFAVSRRFAPNKAVAA